MSLTASLRVPALASMVCAALLLELPAAAAPRHPIINDPGPGYHEYIGDTDHLPVHCRATPRQLLDHARRIPAVRQAMNQFESRGYLARTALDAAANGCPEPSSFVGLAYERPITWLDSSHVVQPAILVVTLLNPANGEPFTTVTAGLAVFDLERGLVFSGDSLDTLEPSFDIARQGGGGGRSVIPEDSMENGARSFLDAYLRWAELRACLAAPAQNLCANHRESILPCFDWVSVLARCVSVPTAPRPLPCPPGQVCRIVLKVPVP